MNVGVGVGANGAPGESVVVERLIHQPQNVTRAVEGVAWRGRHH